jgi:hypothetical protein
MYMCICRPEGAVGDTRSRDAARHEAEQALGLGGGRGGAGRVEGVAALAGVADADGVGAAAARLALHREHLRHCKDNV